MDYKGQREGFVGWITRQLIGIELKGNGEKQNGIHLDGERPLDRFFTGFLFPIVEQEDILEGEEDDDDDELVSESENNTKPVKKEKRYIPPSSAGFSFYITGENIKLRVFYDAVCYEKDSNKDERNQKFVKQRWNKNILTDGGTEVEFTVNGTKQYKIFPDPETKHHKAKIDALWRKYKSGYIVTVTMSNNQKLIDSEDKRKQIQDQNEQTLFEVEFKCIIETGNVDVYPSKDKALLSSEEKEIELRYKDLHIYAVGHGTAVDWAKNSADKMEIWTDFMPTVEVPQVTADTGGKDEKALQFSFLMECDRNKDVITVLSKFIGDYESWIDSQNEKADDEVEEDKETAQVIVKRLAEAKKRMEKGLQLLKEDQLARISFGIANEAMLMQMLSSDKNKGKAKDLGNYKWRPFQIAFVLMVLESATNDDSDYRDTLDLIWFPTGGGKTEAYLGLMAFLFIYRRLKYPASSGGTVSIMRYTLRLLTSQQFVRANKVISALELIRRRNEEKLGSKPFSVGLWVGSASSPNTFYQAKKLVEDKQYSKLILNSCPWCDSSFDEENYIAKDDGFHFTCTNQRCDFGAIKNNILPSNVVDEALYKNPPSLLIATVDKFARLAWEERAGTFFGVNGNRPPELIIQDELHLISSALGSIVGLYEVAIDTILIAKGMRAKYIASTATIKNADKQVKTLFAREMAIFPPSGLRYDDSYFAKTVPLEEKAGRLYVGYLAPLLSRQRCLEPLAGLLLSAPNKVFQYDDEYMDAWWTQVVYHGSLKGVGNSRTLYQSGIKNYLNKFTLDNLKNEIDKASPNFLKQTPINKIDDFAKVKDNEVKKIINKFLPIRNIAIKTLTSNQTAEENAQVFESLATQKGDVNVVDVALATNMISVGLDVTRLALMVINGQPLTTAEYIQASSRVGRGEVPGVVFVNYYKTQARSLSHYENFRSYHDSFYRYVEPSSLTPFTYQARTRALHAALVVAIRHSGIGLLVNEAAGQFDSNDEAVKIVIKELKLRCSLALGKNKEAKDKVHDHIDKLSEEWQAEAQYCRDNKIKLVYNSNDRSYSNLICNFDSKNGKWQTLQSMRNVENSALIKLLSSRKVLDEE